MKVVKQLEKFEPYKLSRHKAWDYIGDSDLLKLDWNECTIKPPPSVSKALMDLVERGNFNFYPDTNNSDLRGALSDYAAVGEGFLEYYSSSDGAHEYIFRTYASIGQRILIVGPTYDNLRVVAEASGLEIRYHYLDSSNGFSPCVNSLDASIRLNDPDFVYICNPNNPTSTLWGRESLEQLIEAHATRLFIIDEAYFEFNGSTLVSSTKFLENLIISRTFSKAFGLAGLRFGYLISSERRIAEIGLIRNGKSVNSFAQVAVRAALRELDFYQEYIDEVMAAKRQFADKLVVLGFNVYCEGGGNFALVDFGPRKQDIVLSLERHKVFVRDLSHLLGEGFVRITIGTAEQMNRVHEIIRGSSL